MKTSKHFIQPKDLSYLCYSSLSFHISRCIVECPNGKKDNTYNVYILIWIWILSIVISIHSICYFGIFNDADNANNDEKQNKLRKLKAAVTQELEIPASIYEQLFHWVLFSSHSLVTANMYSTSQINVRFVCYTLKLSKIIKTWVVVNISSAVSFVSGWTWW